MNEKVHSYIINSLSLPLPLPVNDVLDIFRKFFLNTSKTFNMPLTKGIVYETGLRDTLCILCTYIHKIYGTVNVGPY